MTKLWQGFTLWNGEGASVIDRYTIREVARLTGIPSATLRKWEERYGIVDPLRMPNGYREYTPTDLAALRWVKAKVDGGALVSTAAEELRQRRAEGWEPEGGWGETAVPDEAVGGAVALAQRLVAALLGRDVAAVHGLLDYALSMLSLEAVLIDVVQAALYRIGDLWAAGAISEFQEHYSSVLLRDRLAGLRCLLGRSGGPVFVTACVPGELHELGTIVLGLLASRAGFRVVHLGASPSPEGMKHAISEIKPAVVGLSVSNTQRLQESKRWLEEVSELVTGEMPSALLVLGGLGVEAPQRPVGRFRPIPGDARQAVQEIQALMAQNAG